MASTMTMKRPVSCLRVTALIACAALSSSKCHSLVNNSPFSRRHRAPLHSRTSCTTSTTSIAMAARTKKGGVPRKSASAGIHVGVKKNDTKAKKNGKSRMSTRTNAISNKKPLSKQKNGTTISRGSSQARSRRTGAATTQRRRRPSRPPQYHSRYEMYEHEILTAEEEQRLGRLLQRSTEIKDLIAQSLEEKQVRSEMQQLHRYEEEDPLDVSALFGHVSSSGSSYGDDGGDERDEFADFSVYGMGELKLMDLDRSSFTSIATESLMDEVDDLPLDATQPTSHSILNDHLLTDRDIVEVIGVAGGRTELYRILLEGALARDKLIRSNIRLVVSIAKKWAQQSAKASSNLQGNRLSTIYGGSSERPSLDEAIQEGILGLAAAADRFEPERQLKFGTYATYWVTSYVRKCFQGATTGCFRVPPNYHVVKQNYQKLVKQYYNSDGKSPPMESIAEEMGLKPERLQFILKSTEPLISIDAPFAEGKGPGIGGKAGGDSLHASDLVLKHTLACSEPQPGDIVEVSLLRQCLENAMASELSPHERDVLRLRLGLDDGVSRSAREVVDLFGGTLSVSDVRTAETRAFRKLRSPYALHTYQLLGYLETAGIDRGSAVRFQ